MSKLLIILFLLFALDAQAATTYYVGKGVGGASDSHNCTNNTTQICLTVNKGIGVMAGGDTLVVSAGTYTENITQSGIPAGTSWAAPTTIIRNASDTVIFSATNNNAAYSSTESFIFFDGINFLGGFTVGNGAHHIRVTNSEIYNSTGNGIQVEGSSHDNWFDHSLIHNNGDLATQEHGFYVGGQNDLIEYNKIYSNCGYGVQVYNASGGHTGYTVRYNEIYSNDTCGGFSGGVVITGTNQKVYGNIIRDNPTLGLYVYSGTGHVIYNNTIYNSGVGLWMEVGTTSTAKNNALATNTTNFSDSGTTTMATNFCTTSGGTTGCSVSGASAGFVDATSSNFSLVSGSALINAGTVSIASGITACANGSAPDIGAIESLGPPTATTDGVTAIITVPNNCTSGMLPSTGVTGWTFKKNGSGDTVTANILSGANSYAATLTSAFVGGDTCLFSYSQTGNSTSNNNIGNAATSNQEVLAFTDAACTNITAGGGSVGLSHWEVYLLQGATDSLWVPKCTQDSANCVVAPGSKLWIRNKLRNNSGTDYAPFNYRPNWRLNAGTYFPLSDSFSYGWSCTNSIPPNCAVDIAGIKMIGTKGAQLGTVVSNASATTADILTSDESTNAACVAVLSPSSIPSVTLNNAAETECAHGIEISGAATPGDVYEMCPYTDTGAALTCATPVKLTVGSYQSVR